MRRLEYYLMSAARLGQRGAGLWFGASAKWASNRCRKAE